MVTVQVKMISRMAGPDGTAMPGETPLLPIELAKALVTGGYAEYLDDKPEISVVETATREPEEAAVKPPQKKPARKKAARKKAAVRKR